MDNQTYEVPDYSKENKCNHTYEVPNNAGVTKSASGNKIINLASTINYKSYSASTCIQYYRTSISTHIENYSTALLFDIDAFYGETKVSIIVSFEFTISMLLFNKEIPGF